MLKKGTKLYSIFKAKCPRCHEGEFFAHKFTFNPSKVTKLHDNCPNCNLKYMMEPSFFYGAMYVNYGLTVAALLILAPFNLRLSRIIWINMFVHFDKKFKKKEA